LFELVGNPRIIVFHDELRHFRPFGWRQHFEFFDDILRTHAENLPCSHGTGKSALDSLPSHAVENIQHLTLNIQSQTA
jgi:hypothetical protein